FADAFKMADDVLYCGVRGVTDLMVNPGLVNLDFADIRTVMSEMGKAMMGTGESDGEHRAVEAAEAAISNPLLEGVSMRGAKAVLINITGGYDLTLFEMDEAANRIKNEVDADALIKFGSAIDPDMDGKMRVSVVATGIDAEMQAARPPQVENHAPRRRPALTEAAGVDALRSGQQRQAGEPAYRAAPEAAVPEAEAPVANPAPRAEPSAPTADPIESRVASTPTPAEIRARADRVRESALASRANREAARQARPAFDDDAVAPALFDLDDGSIDPAHRGAMGDADPRGDHPRAHPLGRGMFRGEASDTAPVHPPAHPPAHPPVHPPAPAQAHTPAPAPEQPQRGGMFTINRLINRGARAVAPPAPQARTEPRYDPRMEAAEDDHDDADVPAFLRRQAN
ncbi:MAG: cell division protein FtsZ, partial [Pseudomonadota bacterium]